MIPANVLIGNDLLNKFSGGILGSILGDILASNVQIQTQSNNSSNLIKLSPCTQISLSSLNLLSTGKLEPRDWLASYSSLLPPKVNGKIGSSELAVASLPIILFFHDQPTILREHLSEIATLSKQQNCLTQLWIWSYGISLALQGHIEVEEILPQLLSLREVQDTPLGKQLEVIQNLLSDQASLKQVGWKLNTKSQSSSPPIAQALYCFLSTPQQFRLSVSRSMHMKFQPQLTAILTGAIAGVYNSRWGIPIEWRLHPQLSTINFELKVSEQVEQVVNNWLGVY